MDGEINPRQYAGDDDTTDRSMNTCPNLTQTEKREEERLNSTTAAPPEPHISIDGRLCRVNGRLLNLTRREAEILEMLVDNRGRVVTKEQLYERIYFQRRKPELKILDVFMSKIRKKFRTAIGDDVVRTSWGRGFYIDE